MLEVRRFGPSRIDEAHCRERGIALLPPQTVAELPGVAQLTHLSLQFPGEHCTECAAPDCHDSCDLYQRAPSGLCRRFMDGIVVRFPGAGPFPYHMEILFKNWGRLLTVGNTLCISRRWHRAASLTLLAVGRLSGLVQAAFGFLPGRVHWRISDKIRGAGNRLPRLMNALAARGWGKPAHALLCVIGNPNHEPVAIEITVSGCGDSQHGHMRQQTATITHGWHVIAIPTTDIGRVINLQNLFRVAIVPLIERPTLLQIAYAGFVAADLPVNDRAGQTTTSEPATGPSTDATPGKKVKVLIVDLDNTLWDGIVIENPDASYDLKPGVKDVLTELDRRGILLSIVSKNNLDDVRPILERHGIWDLFLHPQISWQAKSAGIETIVQQLNIGMDTAALIDDSDFERSEVSAALPAVRVYDASSFLDIPQRAEFAVPVTEESQGRRKMYLDEEDRKVEFAKQTHGYNDFLASCNIRVVLEAPSESTMDRIHELVQRTNQLNFSGNRYTRPDLLRILAQPDVIPVVMRCEDRFGSYGIVGFSLLKASTHLLEMQDLMLSCRIQGKQIEHAYLCYLRDAASRSGFERIICHYNRTARNAAAAKVFEELQFHLQSVRENQETYVCQCRSSARETFPATIVDAMELSTRLAATRP